MFCGDVSRDTSPIIRQGVKTGGFARDRRSSNGRSNFSHCFRNIYAIIRDNCHHNSRPPSQSLGTPCRWCLLDSTQNLPKRTTRTHQQFTSLNTIHQRRRKQLHSSIPRHLSSNEIMTKPSRYKATENQCIQTSTWNAHRKSQHLQNKCVITALFDRADNVVSNEKDKIEEKHHRRRA